MNSIYDFIITPTNSRYNNKIKVGDKTLIVNSNIEDHKMVSRHATVSFITSNIVPSSKNIVMNYYFVTFFNIKFIS